MEIWENELNKLMLNGNQYFLNAMKRKRLGLISAFYIITEIMIAYCSKG
jgi:hypothetical protein